MMGAFNPDIPVTKDEGKVANLLAQSELGVYLHKSDFVFHIQRKANSHTIHLLDEWGANVGYAHTGAENHWAVEVSPGKRGQGLGHDLMELKSRFDKKPEMDWSAKRSRMIFLIRHGYVPYSFAGEGIELQDQDVALLVQKLREYYHDSNPEKGNDHFDNYNLMINFRLDEVAAEKLWEKIKDPTEEAKVA